VADRKLEQYQRKRDFARTPEPAGEPAAGAEGGGHGGRFVVQRHRARRLHYDLRLEVDGVLASWAVPKGPTLDPLARNLAVHVEDHPIEYLDFEGVIPAGEYGGGDVIVWDRGTWSPDPKYDDPASAIRDGEIHFDLDGEKLHGRFVLVRRDHDSGAKEQWLLLHKRDEFGREGWDPEDHPHSVKSGRTNDDVAAAPDAMWRSDLPASDAEITLRDTRTWDPPTPDELAALDALGAEGHWQLQGRELRLTNLDKVLFPGRDGEPPITKRELVRYHAQVAPAMLPYLVDRPVNLHRYPQGSAQSGFWHKRLPGHAPEWITRWHNDEADEGETKWYAVIDSVPALVWMANFAALELHPWTSRVADVHRPTWAFVDIDPGEATSLDDLVLLARLHRTALEHLGVAAAAKVTGKRGIQVWIPVEPSYSFDETRAWVEQLSRAIGSTVPELISWKWRKGERGGLARLDYTQNAINRTLVAPFSTRPAPGAPVSVPIGWDELDDPDLRPDGFTIRTVLDRLATVGDPLERLIGCRQRLPRL
jgi:bifunctional non-homologous end joining protein LigD